MNNVLFPQLAAQRRATAASPTVPGAEATANAPTVLVLDDDPAVAETIAALARALGFNARVALTAPEFFAEFDRGPVDAVIIDLLMPDCDGLGVMQELGNRHPVPTILSSGCDRRVLETARHSARGYGLEVIGTLPKPVRRSALKEALQDVQPRTEPAAGIPERAGEIEITPDMVREAFEKGQICAHFQPKMRLSDDKPCGFEALARWRHPEFGTIPPLQFVPLTAQLGLDAELARIMLDQSLRYLADLDKPDLSVAVNIPMRICADPAFLGVLKSALDRYGLSPAHLVLEVTEAGPNGMSADQIDALTRLRMNGFSLSIDDFGTGVSSLERLVRIPFDELKIDRYFARDIATSPSATGVVRSLIQLAKTLGMAVTIEGIEDSESMKLSRELGCDAVQGFHVARPMPPAQARAWLHAQSDRNGTPPRGAALFAS